MVMFISNQWRARVVLTFITIFFKVLFITMAYFRSGLINKHGYWEYSGESVYLVLYPEEQVEYSVFTQNCGTLFQYCQCKAIGKCTERAAVAAPDVVDKC
jgi:hypothetical protein